LLQPPKEAQVSSIMTRKVKRMDPILLQIWLRETNIGTGRGEAADFNVPV
jgi:hypothetical protein